MKVKDLKLGQAFAMMGDYRSEILYGVCRAVYVGKKDGDAGAVRATMAQFCYGAIRIGDEVIDGDTTVTPMTKDELREELELMRDKECVEADKNLEVAQKAKEKSIEHARRAREIEELVVDFDGDGVNGRN